MTRRRILLERTARTRLSPKLRALVRARMVRDFR